jgi:hypothetical protein
MWAVLIEGFLTSDNQATRDAFVMAWPGPRAELGHDDYAAALQRVRGQLGDCPPG